MLKFGALLLFSFTLLTGGQGLFGFDEPKQAAPVEKTNVKKPDAVEKQKPAAEPIVDVVMRSREGGDPGNATCVAKHQTVKIDLRETAIVITDMWTGHWCKRMTESGAALAPNINKFITEARKRGAIIIHCPSGGTGHYKEHKATAHTKTMPSTKKAPNGHLLRGWNRQLPAEKYTMMIDRTPLSGCPCAKRCREKMNTKQLADIKIHDTDFITASGPKMLGILLEKKIKNVFYTGAAIERCVLGRPFGMRHMTACGFKTHIVRDLVDGMHLYPWIKELSHATSNRISLEHVERFIAPTVISASLLDSKNQESLSKNATDNKPSIRYAFQWENKAVNGKTVRLYSQVTSDIYEAVIIAKSSTVGKNSLKIPNIFVVGKEKETVQLKVKNVQLLISGVPTKINWSQNAEMETEINFTAKEPGTRLTYRVTLESTKKAPEKPFTPAPVVEPKGKPKKTPKK